MIASLPNIDLLAVGIVTAAIGILGFVVFFNNRNSITNRMFLIFSIITIIYGSFNYISYQLSSPPLILWFLRLTIFFAVWHAFSFFQLFYVFPEEQMKFSKMHRFFFIPLIILTSLLTLTPFVFSGISQVASSGAVTNPERGNGIILFGLVVVTSVIGGIYFLVKKTLHSSAKEKKRFLIVLTGVLLTFSFLILFNFILPVIFNNLRFLPLTPLFIFPFIICMAYTILRFQFLNIKVISSEILVFFLVISTLFEVLLSRGIGEIIFRIIVFVIALIFSILLIKSTRNEFVQRERMQNLALQLSNVNKKLRQLDEAKSEFISIASHQLRTPLTIIKGYLSLVLEETFGSITVHMKESLEKAAFSTEQLVKLVNELLDLSRIESGKMRYEFAINDLNKIIDEVVDKLRPKADEKHIVIHVEQGHDIPQFMFDRDKIREIVINLLHNAIKYTPKGKIIIRAEVIAKSAKKVVRLSIKDNGMGIAKEDLQKLFTKFGRSQEAKEIDPGGMGLGLFFVKKVAEDHGGAAWAESEGIGKGSIFIVELPLKQS